MWACLTRTTTYSHVYDLLTRAHMHAFIYSGNPLSGGADLGGALLRRLRCAPYSRGTPPKRDTGIASEQEWGIVLAAQALNESGLNEDGSTWYRESGEDLGEKGYRCRWTVMGGRNADGYVEWKETVSGMGKEGRGGFPFEAAAPYLFALCFLFVGAVVGEERVEWVQGAG